MTCELLKRRLARRFVLVGCWHSGTAKQESVGSSLLEVASLLRDTLQTTIRPCGNASLFNASTVACPASSSQQASYKPRLECHSTCPKFLGAVSRVLNLSAHLLASGNLPNAFLGHVQFESCKTLKYESSSRKNCRSCT